MNYIANRVESPKDKPEALVQAWRDILDMIEEGRDYQVRITSYNTLGGRTHTITAVLEDPRKIRIGELAAAKPQGNISRKPNSTVKLRDGRMFVARDRFWERVTDWKERAPLLRFTEEGKLVKIPVIDTNDISNG